MNSSNPRIVVVLGASRSRGKFGNKAVRAYQSRGDRVFPVNPYAEEIGGIPAWPDLDSLPVDRADVVSIYLPPEVGITLLEKIATLDPKEVWFNPGSESAELLRRAREWNLPVVQACSILGTGHFPGEFED